jgi:hypothetical protein
MSRFDQSVLNLCVLLGVLFTGLKLTGYIDWSWWLVLLPLGPHILFGLLVGLLIVLNVVLAVCISLWGAFWRVFD